MSFDSKLKIKLFPHQIDSIQNMELLEKQQQVEFEIYTDNSKTLDSTLYTKLGILSDIPGYGKSYSMISLIARDVMEWKTGEVEIDLHDGKKFSSYFSIKFKPVKMRSIQDTLLVASNSIVHQWKNYASASELKVYVVANKKNIANYEPDVYDLVIVTHTMYNNFVKEHPNYVWKRFVYDEPDTVSIPNMNIIQAGFHWLITSTYEHLGKYMLGNAKIHSHFMKKLLSFDIDVRRLYDTNQMDILSNLVIQNDDEYVRSSFKSNPIQYIQHKCKIPAMVRALKDYIPEDVMRMIDAGDVSGALESLGGGNGQNLFDIVTAKKNEELKIAEFKVELYTKRLAAESDVKSWKEKYDNIAKEIEDIKKKYQDMMNEDCSICYSPLSDPVLMNCCQNMFCGKCILEWTTKTNRNCPLCRASVKYTELKMVGKKKEDEKSKEGGNKHLTKSQMLLNVINKGLQNPHHRFIIFSDYDVTFDVIKTALKSSKINFVHFKGSISIKQKLLEKYKSGEIPVLFFNSTQDCSGLNLEFTTDIIIFHDMCYYVKKQIVGRADRIGRMSELRVHEFVEVIQ